MGENRQISIQKNSKQFMYILSPQGGKHNSPLLRCGLCRITSFQQYGRVRGSDSTVEKNDKHDLSQVIKVSIDSDGMWLACVP